MDDVSFMREAIREAYKARQMNEVPIGAVVVYQGSIIARGYNVRETSQAALSHAELNAISEANRYMKSWRLENCTLYITLEPCPMCAGAIVQSRMKRVVYGAPDLKAGCAGTLMNLLENEQFNHQVEVTAGVMQETCSRLLTDFFAELRARKKS